MNITRHFFGFAPEGLPLLLSALGAKSSSLMSGKFMFSGVTSVSPVQILSLTCWFSRCWTRVSTPSWPILEGVLDNNAVDDPFWSPSMTGSLASKPMRWTRLGRPPLPDRGP